MKSLSYVDLTAIIYDTIRYTKICQKDINKILYNFAISV